MSRYVDPAEESRLIEEKASKPVLSEGRTHEVLAVHDDEIAIWDGERKDKWNRPVPLLVNIGATDGTFRVGDRVTIHVRLVSSSPDDVPNEGGEE